MKVLFCENYESKSVVTVLTDVAGITYSELKGKYPYEDYTKVCSHARIIILFKDAFNNSKKVVLSYDKDKFNLFYDTPAQAIRKVYKFMSQRANEHNNSFDEDDLRELLLTEIWTSVADD